MHKLCTIVGVCLLLTAQIAAGQTFCDTVPVPYAESFDGYGSGTELMPPCWTATRNYDMGYAPHLDGTLHHSGEASLVLYPGTLAESHYSMVIGPPLQVDSLTGLHLHMLLYASVTSAMVEVGLCEDTGRYNRAFTPIDTLHVSRTGRWEELTTDLGRYTGTGRRVAFRMKRSLQADNSPCYIDDISVAGCGTTEPSVSHIGSTQLTLHFSHYGAGDVEISWQPAGGSPQSISGVSSPYTLTGLSPSTLYTISVGCAGQAGFQLEVSTLEGAGLVPAYYEPFDRWRQVNGSWITGGWRFPIGNWHVSSGVLTLSTTGDTCLAVLPLEEAVPIDSLLLRLRVSSTGTASLLAGVMEYAGEISTFTPVSFDSLSDAVPTDGQWRLRDIHFNSYTGTGHYMALMSTGSGTVKIDYARVARCMIDSVHIYNLTDSNVTVAWQETDLPVHILIGDSVIDAPYNPHVLRGLTPATDYTIYVTPTCGDDTCAYDRLSFTTFAHQVGMPYCKTLNSVRLSGSAPAAEQLPQGWVRRDNRTVVLPLMEAQHLSAYLEVECRGSGNLIAGRMATPYGTFQALDTVSVSSNLKRHVLQLDTIGGYCVALHGNGNLTLSSIAIRHAVVTDAWVDSISQTSARLHWLLSDSTGLNIEYKAVTSESADFAEGTGISGSNLTALTPGTWYSVHIGPDDGCGHIRLSFRTLSAPMAVPYCTNFDSEARSGYPDDWRRLSLYGEYPLVSNDRNHSTSMSLRFSATNVKPTVALLPDMVPPSSPCDSSTTLAFWTNVTMNGAGAKLLIGTMGDVTDISTFVPFDTILLNGTADTWVPRIVLLRGHHKRVAMMLVGGSSAETRLFVDDACVEPCAAYNVRVGVTAETTTIYWQSSGASAMECHYWGSAGSGTDTFYTSPGVISGLQENGTYSFRLRAICPCGGSGGIYPSGYSSDGNIASDTLYSFSIHTHPQVVATPWCSGVEGWATGQFPYTWRRSGSVIVTDRNPHRGSRSLLMSGASRLILPPMDTAGHRVASLYAYGWTEAAMADSALTVGIMTDPDSTNSFAPLDTVRLTRMGEWQLLTADLSAYHGTGQYVTFQTATGCSLYVDDIGVDSCGVGNARAESGGILSWHTWGTVDSVDVEYGPAGFTPGSGSFLRLPASQSHTFTSLDFSQSYDFYINTIGGCQRAETRLGNATALPYCENFDATSAGGMPNEWVIGRSYASTPAMQIAGSNNVLLMKGHASGRSIVVMPMVATSSYEGMELSFRLMSTSNTLIVVGEMSDAGDPNTFVGYDTVTGTGAWATYHVALNRHSGPASARLALACLSATSQAAEARIDNMSLRHGLTPDISPVSARQLLLTNSDSNYFVEYGPEGVTQGTTVHVTSAHYIIDNLQPETTYWLHFKSTSNEVPCAAPLWAVTPAVKDLPLCIADTTVSLLILDEPETENIASLHLYLTLLGGSDIEVGMMDRQGDWDSFTAVDSVDGNSNTHISFEQYTGTGRFVALRTIDGGNVALGQLTLTTCSLAQPILNNDNTVHLIGNGWIDYGEGRFAINTDTVIGPLADTTDYDFYLYCTSTEAGCAPPVRIHTTYITPLPYCADSTGGLLPVIADTVVWVSYNLPSGAHIHQRVSNPTGRIMLPPTVLDLVVERCNLPEALVVTQPGNGVVTLSWPDSLDGFYIEYMLHGQPSGTVVQATGGQLTLTLAPDTVYDIFTRCDSAVAGCRRPQQIRTLSSPVALPYCEGFAESTTLPQGWCELKDRADNYVRTNADGRLVIRNYNGTTYAVLPQMLTDSLRFLSINFYARFLYSNGHTVTLGTMSDAADTATFDPVANFTSMGGMMTRCFHSLRHYYGDGHFLALRVADDDLLEIDSLQVTTCAAFNFRLTERNADYAVFEWDQQGSPVVSVKYGPRGAADSLFTTQTLLSDTWRDTISGLQALTDYAFYVWGECGDPADNCRYISPVDTFFTFTPMGGTGCIDYTDLTAPYVSCSYGSYSNPTEHVGAIDYGYLNAASRHTVHFDTAERDARTGGLLRTVPVGSQASVRLGNWITGGNSTPQAESITYGMTVDADEAGLLLLRYAAVLQDPEHGISLQPRFRLQILNSEGQLIDSCGMADFIANANLDWNQSANEVLWKDWTTVGLDLTAYAGQTILIRLTTNDCGEGSHFGYAYFTLGCASKRMQTEGCSDVPDNRFTVPSGFTYRWYSNQDTTATLSDSASIWVASDNNVTYYCDLAFVDNPTCRFTMSAFAGARYPLALMDTSVTVEDCEFDLLLTNRSTISGDGVTPIGTNEPCETIRWLLPDSSESNASTALLHLPDTGLYTVSLIAGIANNQCLDTLTRQVHIVYPHPATAIIGADSSCDNLPQPQMQVLHARSYSWTDTADNLEYNIHNYLFTAATIDSNGCADTLNHLLRVFPSYSIDEADSICATSPTYSLHDSTLTFEPSTQYSVLTSTFPFTTVAGCDSVFHLTLNRMPAYYIDHADTLCYGGATPYFDTILASTGTYVHIDSTAFGCDSIVTLALVVRDEIRGTDWQEVCDSLRWINRQLYLSDTIGVTDTLTAACGCDSIVTLSLAVHPSYYSLAADTACERDPYYYRGRLLTQSGYYADTLGSQYGCDSVLALQLNLLPTPYVRIDYDYDCETLIYTLIGTTDVPYYVWSSNPHDTLTDHHDPIDLMVFADPETEGDYTLMADYDSTGRCPQSVSVTLRHPTLPVAEMRVRPPSLDPDAPEFYAYDIGEEYQWRRWIVCGVEQDESSRQLYGAAPIGVDTVGVALVVSDGHCTDTAWALLPVRYSGLSMPNVFTPGSDDENGLFRLGIHNLRTATIDIYNRQGMLVFHADDPAATWDGTDLQGHPCPMGAYVVKVVYTTVFQPDAKQSKVTTVTLVR